jgi:hypothetical protein
MIGGIVIEVCDHPTDQKVYINCKEFGKSTSECAVFVEKDENSANVEVGDTVWWHGKNVFWTPAKNREKPCKDLIAGTDYDVKLKKIGYSGAKHPYPLRQKS